MNLKIIKGTPLHELYLKAFANCLSDPDFTEQKDAELLKKAVYYGTKYIVNHKYTDEKAIPKKEIEFKFQFITFVKQLMSLLTPKQFENLFPIEKTYDGEKNGWKDYFFVKEKLSHYDSDKPIGDMIEDLLWDYQNDNIERFMVTMLSTASKLRQCQGKPGIMEEWAEKNDIKTLTVNENAGYIMDNSTHRTVPYHKPIPNYFQIVR